jgi:hypothetical protein
VKRMLDAMLSWETKGGVSKGWDTDRDS